MTNVEELKNRALVSDLMDGRLRGTAFAHAVDLASTSGDAREAWHANHVIGDILRFGDAAGLAADAQFADRFRTRLAQIQPVSAPGDVLAPDLEFPVDEARVRYNTASANHSSFRWKVVAGVASFVAVAAMGWSVLSSFGGPDSSPQMAQSGAGNNSGLEPQVMIRDPHLDALLAAHKQFGGTSALQMPAGFLRNATFESPSR